MGVQLLARQSREKIKDKVLLLLPASRLQQAGVLCADYRRAPKHAIVGSSVAWINGAVVAKKEHFGFATRPATVDGSYTFTGVDQKTFNAIGSCS